MRTLTLILLITLIFPASNTLSGGFGIVPETDNAGIFLIVPFDLRDRESFFQITNVDSSSQTVHVQIYNVANLCNENNFFDAYTPNDTHIYNLRNILTNDTNPSGVVLPDDAYGIIVASVPVNEGMEIFQPLIGNIRINDNLGYEYRTNAITNSVGVPFDEQFPTAYFNYNSESGVVLSDVFGIALSTDSVGEGIFEATLDNVLGTWVAVDVDIINNNEVLFSCRDVVFSCVDENNPLIEEILTQASQGGFIFERSSASVARYEYGINNVIPNSKGGELLCPGNIIPEGEVILTIENIGEETDAAFGYVGLNNGNGRGSFDSFFTDNFFDIDPS